MVAVKGGSVARGRVAGAAAARPGIAGSQRAGSWAETAGIVTVAGHVVRNALAARATVVVRVLSGRIAAVGGKHRSGGDSGARAMAVDTRSRQATGGASEVLLGAASGAAAGAPAMRLVA